ncbi:MAG: hypothetical protein FWC30_00895 [Candidatus Bathyarchaeota archaeon]|nr:hypothetical protein [Candidatus Termiticorpusculum sp.]
MTTLMFSSFGAVLATTNTGLGESQGSGISLEEFIHLYAQYKSNGDAAEYKRIYSQLTSTDVTLEIRPGTGVPAADNDDVTPQPIVTSEKMSVGTQTTRANYWVTSATSSPQMKDIYGAVVGTVTNIGNMIGTPDSKYVKLETTSWNKNYSNPLPGEALTNGNFGRTCTGSLEVRNVYTDKPMWDNYMVIQYYYGGTWTYLAATKVKDISPMDYVYVFSASFSAISVSCMSMAPTPISAPVLQNSVLFDAVGAQ